MRCSNWLRRGEEKTKIEKRIHACPQLTICIEGNAFSEVVWPPILGLQDCLFNQEESPHSASFHPRRKKRDLPWQSGLSIVPVMEALVLNQVKQGVSCGSFELSAEQQAAGA